MVVFPFIFWGLGVVWEAVTRWESFLDKEDPRVGPEGVPIAADGVRT